MLLICKDMFDVGDTYLVNTNEMTLNKYTYCYGTLHIKRLTPRSLDSLAAYEGTFQYLVSREDKTFQIKKIYKAGDTYEI